ncbi:MAG: iron-sulfur cluster assembly protein, partial [Nitrospirae bacterium]|nr:iron-sulfur cluster assembly protein [Fimbriimonadaceae bacterium]
AGGEVSFQVELTTPVCPVKDLLKPQCEVVVGALPGVERAEVEMSARVRELEPPESVGGGHAPLADPARRSPQTRLALTRRARWDLTKAPHHLSRCPWASPLAPRTRLPNRRAVTVRGPHSS